MTVDPSHQLPPPEQKNHSKKFKIIGGMALFFLIVGIAIFLWWLLWGRFHESTNDAYVNGNMVVITAQIPGTINKVYADDTNYVEQNQILIELDPTDTQIALDKAKAHLANTVRRVVNLFAKVRELESKLEMREAELIRAMQDFEHRKALLDTGSISLEDYQHAEAALKTMLSNYFYTQYQLAAAIAQVENTTILTHPLLMQAKERLKTAWVNRKRCTIVSPARGLVAMRRAQVGTAIDPSFPLMSIVPLDQMWVDANFKEVHLKNMRVGQPVKITADIYGGGTIFHGKIMGLAGGTGSVFSALPPQNATGNWIKIVQRLPVRIRLEPQEVLKHPLRLGLSLEVTVDTTQREGLMIPSPVQEKPIYETGVFATQIDGSDALIEQIIHENLDPSLWEEHPDENEDKP